MRNVNIQVIPHSEQRYETCGDWWYDELGTLHIRVSETGDFRYNQLIAFHEYAEAILCANTSVTEKQVTEFDLKFEQMRVEFPEIVGDSEPGNTRAAPYYWQHGKATSFEQKLASLLGVNWNEYCGVVNNLSK